MGRSRKFDEEEVLDAARDIFRDKGFEGTSLSDLMRVMDMQKGSIYKAFKSKRALFLTVLERECTREIDFYRDMLESKTSPKESFLALLQTLFLNNEDEAYRRCFAMNTMIEMASADEEIATRLHHHRERLEGALEYFFMQSHGFDEIDLKIVPQSAARLSLGFINGLYVEQSCMRDRDRLEDMIKGFLSLLFFRH